MMSTAYSQLVLQKKKKNKKMMVGRERERNRDIKQMWQNVK